MKFLTIHCGHNSSAALMIDGRIVGAVQEERFACRKNQVAFPVQSIRHLLDRHLAGDIAALDRVGFTSTDVDPIGFVISRYTDFSVFDHIRENKEYWYGVFYEGKPHDGWYWREMYRRGECLNRDHNVDPDEMINVPFGKGFRYDADVGRAKLMTRHFGWNGPNQTIDHHTCHAYYAFYGAPIPRDRWEDTLVLTADALGDGLNWSASIADREGRLTRVGQGMDHGVARIYRFVTLLLGMKPNEHEYKIMGLSGYRTHDKYVAAVEEVFSRCLDFRDGRFVQDQPLRDSYFDLRDRLEGYRFDNIATGLQSWATRVTSAWAAHWLRETKRRVLCFSGGLSMNIKLNGDLLSLPEIDILSVPASGGDETNPIGACYVMQAESGAPVEVLAHPYLGHLDESDPDNDWRAGLARAGADPAHYAVREGIGPKEIARLLAANEIVARCAGPMEFGARALGNRSILANPSDPANLKTINDAIKNRDFWMPFTPSILAEAASRYLLVEKPVVSPYMTIGYRTTELARKHLAAALHPGDFSARPHFVSRASNETYWRIISEFEALTGISGVLNTSLNLHGEPMNWTVAQAARTLALSALSFLALPGDALLYKVAAKGRLEAVLADSNLLAVGGRRH